jgi:hypothetical protein
MGQLHVTQIQRRIEETVLRHIDVSDLAKHLPADQERARLSRALAAFVVLKLTGMEPMAAAASVTDGQDDNGIDAIAVVPDRARIVIVQSKWASDDKGSAGLDEMLKFREGVKDLVELKWEAFNQRVRSRSNDIEQVLLKTSVTIDVVFAHMGTGELAADVRRRIDDFVADMNDPSPTAAFSYYGQKQIHRLLVEEQSAPRIDLTVELSDWGQVDGPPRAIYGQVHATEVVDWFAVHGRNLLAKNVRLVLPDSEVNQSLVDTASNNPSAFWYYNNGITVLCDSIEKAPAGGADRRLGTFAFSGASIVNGAQTVGSLSRAATQGKHDDLKSARVMVRFISLEHAPPNFASEVTRATNTQNRIGGRDFLSLDPEQARLRDEFAVEKLSYVYRNGETDPQPDLGCGVVDASVALACADSAALATQAKREISRLWDDIERAPYKQLFNATTTYLRVWRSVQVLRVVEAELTSEADSLEARPKGIAVHGNRLLLHLVFQQLHHSRIDDPEFAWDAEVERARSLVRPTLAEMVALVESDFPGYPASLFKNATKTADLARRVLARRVAALAKVSA